MIGVFGCNGTNNPAYNLYIGLHELGYDAIYIVNIEWFALSEYDFDYYILSCLPLTYKGPIHNDVDKPVIYIHTEITRPPSIDKCNILLTDGKEINNFLTDFYPSLVFNAQLINSLSYGVNLAEYPELHKKFNCFTPLHFTIQNPSNFIHYIIYQTRQQFKEIIPHHEPVSYDIYRKELCQSHHTIILLGDFCRDSQRVYEAAAARCVPLIYHKHQPYYETIGLIHSVNCFYWKNEVELYSYLETPHPKMEDAIYDWVQDKTYKDRILQLIQYLEVFLCLKKSVTA